MWNTNKVLLNAMRILQVTRLQLCQVFGSDRVDEEAQQEKNAPLRYPLKAHGHIPSAWIHLNSQQLRAHPIHTWNTSPTCPESRLSASSRTVPLTWTLWDKTNRLRFEPQNCVNTETRSNTKARLCSTITHQPVGTPQFMRVPRPARDFWGQSKYGTPATLCGH